MPEQVDRGVQEVIEGDPYASELGAELEEIRPGYARVSLRLRPEHLNFLGLVHGGIIFSLADVAFAAASNSFGTRAVALHVSVDYLRPPGPGSRLTAEVRHEGRAGKMGYYLMEVRDEGGDTVARLVGWAYHTGKPLAR
ncbi:MAG: hotdog fold thioesterase [Candidatus Geothermincolales bacterium]